MAQDRKQTYRALSRLWNSKRIKILPTRSKKYALLSDIHLGNGGSADDFRKNKPALLAALKFYRREGFSLILLGDIEEFWQFDLYDIKRAYNKSVYAAIRAFGDKNTHRIYGNHDIEWGTLIDPAKNEPEIQGAADEAIGLKDVQGKLAILLLHGHQGSIESEKHAWSSKFFVRLFKLVEAPAKLFGLYGHGSAFYSQIPRDYEKVFFDWAKKNKVMVIVGHSHRAIFASRSYIDKLQEEQAKIQAEINTNSANADFVNSKLEELEPIAELIRDEESKNRNIKKLESSGNPPPCYFNTGCALYSAGITAIEIANNKIALVKWTRAGKKDPRFNDSANLTDLLCQIRS